MAAARLGLDREQVLAHRRHVQHLDERLRHGPAAFRTAAWAGLQDSMPRAALLSLHARVERVAPDVLDEPTLVQLWGPRFQVYVVDHRDVAPFTLGRLPSTGAKRDLAEELAARLRALLGDGAMRYGDAGQALGEHHNRLRYAAPTGTLLLSWDGARQPTIRSVDPPEVDPHEARLELARRHLHLAGPTTPEAFASWAGLTRSRGPATYEALADELLPVRTPVGDAWLLAHEEPTLHADRDDPPVPAPARLLPSGDVFFLLQGRERELLVPDAAQRDRLWTSRVWPGALLVGGDVAGTWRRAQHRVRIAPWRRLTAAEREAVEAEAADLPLPGLDRAIDVVWED